MKLFNKLLIMALLSGSMVSFCSDDDIPHGDRPFFPKEDVATAAGSAYQGARGFTKGVGSYALAPGRQVGRAAGWVKGKTYDPVTGYIGTTTPYKALATQATALKGATWGKLPSLPDLGVSAFVNGLYKMVPDPEVAAGIISMVIAGLVTAGGVQSQTNPKAFSDNYNFYAIKLSDLLVFFVEKKLSMNIRDIVQPSGKIIAQIPEGVGGSLVYYAIKLINALDS